MNGLRGVKAIMALALCAGLGFRPAFASTVVVPDDSSTIQQGIDSGADTVLIREGYYPDPPLVDHAGDEPRPSLSREGHTRSARRLIAGWS